jgi:hypothetical protein
MTYEQIDNKRDKRYQKIQSFLFDLSDQLELMDRPIIIQFPDISERKAEKALTINQQMFELNSEVQTLKNQLNKYLKVEIREESIRTFTSLISKIKEIVEVYVQHMMNGILFWIFYGDGNRVEIIEKVVDVECSFENIFSNLNFDYRILPVTSKPSNITGIAELIYARK